MKISKRHLKNIIESFLYEEKHDQYKCPNCSHVHKSRPAKKCENCGYKYGPDWHEKNENVTKLVSLYEQAKKFICPEPAKNVGLNTANRDRAIKADFIKYGPLNVNEPGDFWEKIASRWDTPVESAKLSLCGNCVAFDISPQMEKCMPGDVTQDEDGGRLGYCWMHHFKCHSMRTCNTWAKGGPIDNNKGSMKFFDRNKEGALKKEPIDPDIYQDV